MVFAGKSHCFDTIYMSSIFFFFLLSSFCSSLWGMLQILAGRLAAAGVLEPKDLVCLPLKNFMVFISLAPFTLV